MPNRIDFDPFPWHSFAVWILTQMKRWGQIKGEVDYAGHRVAGVPRHRHRQADEGGGADAAGRRTSKTFAVMGKTFDPDKPEDYIKSFAIKRAA